VGSRLKDKFIVGIKNQNLSKEKFQTKKFPEKFIYPLFNKIA